MNRLKQFLSLLLLIITFTNSFFFAQGKQSIDSLKKSLSIGTDSNKVKSLNLLSRIYLITDVDSSSKYASEALKLANQLKYLPGKVEALNNLSSAYNDKSLFDSAKTLAEEALTLCARINNKNTLRSVYVNIGNIHQNLGDYYKAIEYFLLGLKIAEEQGNTQEECAFLLNIGNCYMTQEKFAQSKQYYNRVLEIKGIANDVRIMSYVYAGLGGVYYYEKNYGKALEMHIACKKYAIELGDKINTTTTLENIGNDYVGLKDYDKAKESYNEALELSKEIGDLEGLGSINVSIGQMYLKMKKYNFAVQSFNASLHYSDQIQSKHYRALAYKGLAEGYSQLQDYNNAFNYAQRYQFLKDSISNEKSEREIASLLTLYEKEKDEKTISLMEKEIQLRKQRETRQRIFNYSLVGFSLLLTLLGLLIYRGYQNKRKMANVLQEKNEEITLQKNEIELNRNALQSKNMLITDSINYAKRLQGSVLPDHNSLKKYFSDSFIYYSPKDIVSGDFFWLHEVQEKVFISVVDCTGHGVPGAFMSVVANGLLNDIIDGEQAPTTNMMLDKLNAAVINTIKQPENDSIKDGMDIALCCIDRQNLKLQFSGAKNSLYVINNGALNELKADKFSIGSAGERKYSSKEAQLCKGDMVYLFSDGYVDQKGGPSNTKFYYDTFKELLTKISGLNSSDQLNELTVLMNEWKGDKTQLDDMMIVGFRV